jgi:hypothetical protein
MLKKLTRREFIKRYLFYSIIFSSFFIYEDEVLAYAPSKIVIENVDLEIDNLPAGFKNFKIAQLSDLHLSNIVKPWLIQKTVAMTNELKPDLIVITGDLANDLKYLKECCYLLCKLKAPYGIYAVTGNWEVAYGLKDSKAIIRGSYMKLLDNKTEYIKKNGDTICLSGVDDDKARGFTLEKTYQGVDNKFVKILLCHNPYILAKIKKAKKRIDIVLSGHTHGGQVVYPVVGALKLPTAHGLEFRSGFYEYNNSRVYINRGIGVVKVGFRVNCPPEITLFNLKRSKNKT